MKRDYRRLGHLVDAGYVDGDLLVQSAEKYGIELFGPTRGNNSWQSRTGGIDATQFEVDWDNRKVLCPAGKSSALWLECHLKERNHSRVVKVKFRRKDCLNCANRARCVRSEIGAPRQLLLQAREFHEAIKKTRALFSSGVERGEYKERAGIEGTLSQGIRRGTVRRARYKGLQKTHLQETATAAGINILRTINHLTQVPIAKTRVSRFARLAH
jgi:transposase